ncbi:MAG: alpha-hydroxy-acid oxidizing protein [SAR324 cluster bacterium]|nr:alpha-hydroxy-acid oxidizing protein [SAR324 cluster bacterium]
MNQEKYLTLHEIVKAARLNLDQGLWDYLIGGSETETSLKRNRQALDSLAFRPRVLHDVSELDASSSFLGHPLRIPVLLAPIGSLQAFEAGGGASAAKAAEIFGTINILSSACKPDLETVADASNSAKMYQLYLLGDDAWMDQMINRAIDAGYVALCLVPDMVVYSRRERDLAKRFLPPTRRKDGHQTGGNDLEANFGFQAKLSWDTVKRVKDRYPIPLVLKGIATAEDAGLACEHGVEVIYVSNHGGRQLDHGRGTIDMLPEIVREVNGRASIVVDGGFMRGTDVVKGIALGADAVGIGKLEGLAMAADGVNGVVRALELLELEIQNCLAMLGVTRLDQLNPSYLCNAKAVGFSDATSAFPLLNLEDAGY